MQTIPNPSLLLAPIMTQEAVQSPRIKGGVLYAVREKTGGSGHIYRFERFLEILMHTATND